MAWVKSFAKLHDPPSVMYAKTDEAIKMIEAGFKSPTVVVSGDIDDPAVVSTAALDRPNLVRWFAQNLHTDHPKAIAIPIGVDFHTLEEGTRRDWGPDQTAQIQNDHLMKVRAQDNYRSILVLMNFTIATNTTARQACHDALHDKEFVTRLEAGTRRSDVWDAMSRSSFMVCPDGNGVDTHRLWECLALRCIPIVTRPPPPMERLYKKLPIVIVDSWDEVTPKALEEWLSKYYQPKGTPPPDPATQAYWNHQIDIRKR
jgi:hypothetical protein